MIVLTRGRTKKVTNTGRCMAIDITSETMVLVSECETELWGKPSRSALRCAMEKGHLPANYGPQTERVHLEKFKYLGRWATSKEAWMRYLSKLNPGNDMDFTLPDEDE